MSPYGPGQAVAAVPGAGLSRATTLAWLGGTVARRMAYAAGGAAAAAGGAAFLFRAETLRAQRVVGHRLGDRGPDADGTYGAYGAERGRPLRLLVAGDSVAGSLGAASPEATLGAVVAEALSGHARRTVELRTVAVVGAETAQIHDQLDDLPAGYRPDIVLIIVGGNDITRRLPVATSVHDLQGVLHRLRRNGAEVVVGTCPDFYTLPALPRPLRDVGGRLSRRLAQAQYKAAVAMGARPVLLGRAVRQVFLAAPQEMFAIDGFHPSSLGYLRAAQVMLPAVLAAYDHGDFPETP